MFESYEFIHKELRGQIQDERLQGQELITVVTGIVISPVLENTVGLSGEAERQV